METDDKKLKVEIPIVVEGRSDTRAVMKAVDGLTIETHGYGISEDTFRKLDSAYKERGFIVLTDPDFAGRNIRKTLKERYPEALHAYIEKDEVISKGNIGIENADVRSIINALSRALAKGGQEQTKTEKVEYRDLCVLNLTRCEEARENRKKVGRALGIGYANSREFLKRINFYGITVNRLKKILGR